MTQPADRGALTERIARLSPEKRELLRRVLARGEGGPRAPREESLHITRSALAGDEGKNQGRRLYELVNRNLDRSPFAAAAVFLNLGYVDDGSPRSSPVTLPRHCVNRNAMQLALEVIADTDLAGRDVADVGCGRGGTIALIRTHFRPRRVIGVDFSSAALAFCRRTHRYDATSFVLGNAQELPLRSGSLDVVTNIESASGYPDVERFYGEVARVLKPAGWFLYADVVPRAALAHRRRRLAEIGLVVETEHDVTSNVLLSCDETARTHRAAIEGAHDEEVMGEFLGSPQSSVYRQMRDGALAYLVLRSRRAS